MDKVTACGLVDNLEKQGPKLAHGKGGDKATVFKAGIDLVWTLSILGNKMDKVQTRSMPALKTVALSGLCPFLSGIRWTRSRQGRSMSNKIDKVPSILSPTSRGLNLIFKFTF